jgi:hypothetical protein
MGCSNFVTNENIVQIIASIFFPTPTQGWKHVAANKQYEEKYWNPVDRRTGKQLLGRMERPTRQAVNSEKPDYPHFTEVFDSNGKRQNYVEKGGRVTQWDAHYSYIENGEVKHKGAHKTAQAIIDDLEALLK